ncbi:MAG: M23 family metallopeptidase [Clostridia bacterium]|nr:M23 family metallopeptidase [Clostridia bacterium]
MKNGEVTHAGWQNEYGNCVEVKHIGDEGKIFYSFYAHMRDNSICVEKGQTIAEGQVIGIQGSTGNSTGDHLHFEIRLEDKSTIDPISYLFK